MPAAVRAGSRRATAAAAHTSGAASGMVPPPEDSSDDAPPPDRGSGPAATASGAAAATAADRAAGPTAGAVVGSGAADAAGAVTAVAAVPGVLAGTETDAGVGSTGDAAGGVAPSPRDGSACLASPLRSRGARTRAPVGSSAGAERAGRVPGRCDVPLPDGCDASVAAAPGPAGSPASARATAGFTATAAPRPNPRPSPTPSAIASAPTRPTWQAWRFGFSVMATPRVPRADCGDRGALRPSRPRPRGGAGTCRATALHYRPGSRAASGVHPYFSDRTQSPTSPLPVVGTIAECSRASDHLS